jgi:ABC-2 type transport system ATP-binding protein
MTTIPSSVEAVGLTKRYGETLAVDHLDLTIAPGEIFGLLGPNGAGKTTTILMLLGLSEPTGGHAFIDGLDPTRDPLQVKSRVGYLPDDVGFYPELTGRQNLRYTARLNRLGEEAEERIEQLLLDVGLAGAGDRPSGEYSRGMRQRLGLADALVKEPTILILDEPTVNIDPAGVQEILDLVLRLREERHTTVLLSSHLLHQVERVCDRIGIFVGGRLAGCGTVDELARGLGDGEVVEVELDAPVEAATALLTGLAAVRKVERSGPRFTVRSDRDVRVDVVDACHDAGWPLLHLERRHDLDAVYQSYFRPAEARR